MTTLDPIRQRANEVAALELKLLGSLHRSDELVLAALRQAYFQGRIDVRFQVLDELRSQHAALDAAADAARSVA